MFDYVHAACRRGEWTSALRAVYGGITSGFTVEPHTLGVVFATLAQQNKWVQSLLLYQMSRRTVALTDMTFHQVLRLCASHPTGWHGATLLCCERMASGQLQLGDTSTQAALLSVCQKTFPADPRHMWLWCLQSIQRVQNDTKGFVEERLESGQWREALEIVTTREDWEGSAILRVRAMHQGHRWDALIEWAGREWESAETLPAEIRLLIFEASARSNPPLPKTVLKYLNLLSDAERQSAEVAELLFLTFATTKAAVPALERLLKVSQEQISLGLVGHLITAVEMGRTEYHVDLVNAALEKACTHLLTMDRTRAVVLLHLFISVQLRAARSVESVSALEEEFRTLETETPAFMQTYYERICLASTTHNNKALTAYRRLPKKNPTIAVSLMRTSDPVWLRELLGDALVSRSEWGAAVAAFSKQTLHGPQKQWFEALQTLQEHCLIESQWEDALSLVAHIAACDAVPNDVVNTLDSVLPHVIPKSVKDAVLLKRWAALETNVDLQTWLFTRSPTVDECQIILEKTASDNPCTFSLLSYTLALIATTELHWSKAVTTFVATTSKIAPQSAAGEAHCAEILSSALGKVEGVWEIQLALVRRAQIERLFGVEEISRMGGVSLGRSFVSAPWQVTLSLLSSLRDPPIGAFEATLSCLEAQGQHARLIELCMGAKGPYRTSLVDEMHVQAIKSVVVVLEHRMQQMPEWRDCVALYQSSLSHQNRLLRPLEKRVLTARSVVFVYWFCQEIQAKSFVCSQEVYHHLLLVALEKNCFELMLTINDLRQAASVPLTNQMRELVERAQHRVANTGDVESERLTLVHRIQATEPSQWSLAFGILSSVDVKISNAFAVYQALLRLVGDDSRRIDMVFRIVVSQPRAHLLAESFLKEALHIESAPILRAIARYFPNVLDINSHYPLVTERLRARLTPADLTSLINELWTHEVSTSYLAMRNEDFTEEITVALSMQNWVSALHSLHAMSRITPNPRTVPQDTAVAVATMLLDNGQTLAAHSVVLRYLAAPPTTLVLRLLSSDELQPSHITTLVGVCVQVQVESFYVVRVLLTAFDVLLKWKGKLSDRATFIATAHIFRHWKSSAVCTDTLRDVGSSLLVCFFQVLPTHSDPLPKDTLITLLHVVSKWGTSEAKQEALQSMCASTQWDPVLKEQFSTYAESFLSLRDLLSLTRLLSVYNKFASAMAKDRENLPEKIHEVTIAIAPDESRALEALIASRKLGAWQMALWIMDTVYTTEALPLRKVPSVAIQNSLLALGHSQWQLAAKSAARWFPHGSFDSTSGAILISSYVHAGVRPDKIMSAILHGAPALRDQVVKLFFQALNKVRNWESALSLYIYCRTTQEETVHATAVAAFAEDYIVDQRTAIGSTALQMLCLALVVFDVTMLRLDATRTALTHRIPPWMTPMVKHIRQMNQTPTVLWLLMRAQQEDTFLHNCLTSLLNAPQSSPENLLDTFTAFGTSPRTSHFEIAIRRCTNDMTKKQIEGRAQLLGPKADDSNLLKYIAVGQWQKILEIIGERVRAGRNEYLSNIDLTMDCLQSTHRWKECTEILEIIVRDHSHHPVLVTTLRNVVTSLVRSESHPPLSTLSGLTTVALKNFKFSYSSVASLLGLAMLSVSGSRGVTVLHHLLTVTPPARVPWMYLPLQPLMVALGAWERVPPDFLQALSRLSGYLNEAALSQMDSLFASRADLSSWVEALRTVQRYITTIGTPTSQRLLVQRLIESSPPQAGMWSTVLRLSEHNDDRVRGAFILRASKLQAPWDYTLTIASQLETISGAPLWMTVCRRILDHNMTMLPKAFALMMEKDQEMFPRILQADWQLALRILQHGSPSREALLATSQAVITKLSTGNLRKLTLHYADWLYLFVEGTFVNPSIEKTLKNCLQYVTEKRETKLKFPLLATRPLEENYLEELNKASWSECLHLYVTMWNTHVHIDRALGPILGALGQVPQGILWKAALLLYNRHSEALLEGTSERLVKWLHLVVRENWVLACRTLQSINQSGGSKHSTKCALVLMHNLLQQRLPQQALQVQHLFGNAKEKESEAMLLRSSLTVVANAMFNAKRNISLMQEPDALKAYLEKYKNSWLDAIAAHLYAPRDLVSVESVTRCIRSLRNVPERVGDTWRGFLKEYPEICLTPLLARSVIQTVREQHTSVRLHQGAVGPLFELLVIPRTVATAVLESIEGDSLGWWGALIIFKASKEGRVETDARLVDLLLRCCAESRPTAWAAGLHIWKAFSKVLPSVAVVAHLEAARDLHIKRAVSALNPTLSWYVAVASLRETFTKRSFYDSDAEKVIMELNTVKCPDVRSKLATMCLSKVSKTGSLLQTGLLAHYIETCADSFQQEGWQQGLAVTLAADEAIKSKVERSRWQRLHRNVATLGWEKAIHFVLATRMFDADVLFDAIVAATPGDTKPDLTRFDELVDASLTPELSTYRSLLLTCEHHTDPTQWESAARMFGAMEKEAEVKPDANLYGALMRVLCGRRGDQWEEAVRVALRKDFTLGSCQSYYLQRALPPEVWKQLRDVKGHSVVK